MDTPAAKPFTTELARLTEAAPGWLGELGQASWKAFEAGGANAWLALLAMFAAGVIGERLVGTKLVRLSERIGEQASGRWYVVAGYAMFRIAFDIVRVLLFGVFAWIALLIVLGGPSVPAYFSLRQLLVAVVWFRIWMVVMRALLAPRNPEIRCVSLDTPDAVVFYRWVLLFIGTYLAMNWFGALMFVGGLPPLFIKSTAVAVGVLLNVTGIAFIWANRRRLARLFTDHDLARDGSDAPGLLGQLLGQSWPWLATAWMTGLWATWAHSIFTEDFARTNSVLIAWWITLLFPIGDRVVSIALKQLTGSGFFAGEAFVGRSRRFRRIVQGCLRATFVVVALVAMATAWQVAATDLMQDNTARRVVGVVFDIGLVLLAAYVLYEVVMALLEQHLPNDDEAEDIEIEGEGGGAGATREETLAPLLRVTFLLALGLVVVLTVLSAVGVEVLPLIAGASIIGVAVGFGSQKLVQDIISGVFFLIDDAFRRGEYIDIGSVKGTVEKISVRSMQLRHHMGALHTVPFGEIGHLTNFSRDWVMMKLKLRLTYDTDVERVRKVVKKLGQGLMDDPELGPKFLEPLKSQGVYSMEDDSAMIIRVKFMTRPGDQFVVRKAVYAKLRDTFEREGIEFAHRVVSVRVDGAGAAGLSDEQRQQIAGSVLPAEG